MIIEKIVIVNFKCFKGQFSLALNPGLNILVGDNEAGKSTILEAVHLALSGWIHGKYLATEISESLFNNKVVKEYLDSLKTSNRLSLPHIIIEVFFNTSNDSMKALFEGNDNSTKKPACGIRLKIEFNDKFQPDYEMLLKAVALGEEVNSLPIEFYDFSWSSFARDERVTPKSIPLKSALIDSTNTRLQNGSDMYISRIIRDSLSDEHKVKMSQAHRRLKDIFAKEDAVKEINDQLKQKDISEKKVELSVDLSTRTAWETSLTTYLDDVPFSFIGKGEQCLIKTRLALSHKKTQEANILLLEEPENHLSHSKLNKLISYIRESQNKKQIIISTHSSFVANKLGLENLVLLNCEEGTSQRRETRFNDLSKETYEFFEKLSGYDTLRLILCKKAILVEGPSDELIIQKAYLINNKKLPIEDEIDVISVGTSFLRFLEVAEKIKKPVAVVTDNDGDYANKITKKYSTYASSTTIKVFADTDNSLNTLEPHIARANTANLDILRTVLGLGKDVYPDEKSIADYMVGHKTSSALKIFDTTEDVKFPQYILDAIK